MEFFTWVLDNKLDISFVLSLISTFLLIIGSIYRWFRNRPKLKVSLINCSKLGNTITCYIQIVNSSGMPISITNMYITVGDKILPASNPKVKIIVDTETRGGEVVWRNDIFTMDFPININSNSGTSGYIQFVDNTKTLTGLPTTLELSIDSNHNNPLLYSLELDAVPPLRK